MRALRTTLLAATAALAPLSAMAADITPEGASEIERALTYYLPKSIVDDGLVKVTPGTRRYELTLDLKPLLDLIDKKDFSITGLKPFVHYLTPQDDGLWKVEQSDRLDVTANMTVGPEKADVTYIIDKILFTGLFDPSLRYFKDADTRLENMMMTSTSKSSSMSMTLDSLTSKSKVTSVSDGIADITATMDAATLTELISGGAEGQVHLTAGKITGDVSIDRLRVDALRDLITFTLELIKNDAGPLDATQSAHFKELIRANIPLADMLREKIAFQDFKVRAKGTELTVKEVGYHFDFNGLQSDSRFTAGMSIEGPSVESEMMPPGMEDAVPERASFEVAVGGIDLAGILNYVADHADFTKTDPLTAEQQAEIGRLVLPSGRLEIGFTDVSARSGVYDVAMEGTMSINPDDNKDARADVTITARNFDRTISFMQEKAGLIPELGQGAFMAMAMKGFAKQQPDGALVWNVKVDAKGDVTINGQPMKM